MSPLFIVIYSIVHSSVNGHVGCFHLSAIKNTVAVNVHVQFLCVHVFLLLLASLE